ncbi:diguanylate cyclase (GGDEF) domain-containing protein [Lentzea waywayandensis]|uniref:Diguanylate cyclase (GGDEF) domain-containing protein n=1 Tax=Lentzea waywayandensis TaxID=84724 RepID=A0A1I6D3K4_9PSEU|nr:diguanylate cyclase [Lentzea waywayandensis]SFQ99897.1 diguanylate cyclase (GGDEF) domain-containing protein [Lentzea waywayandensis]
MTNPPGTDRGVLRTLFTDAVTGALARGGLDGCLDGAIVRARRTGGCCSAFVFDVDHFKTVNDAYGHARGDTVLRLIVERAKAVVRDADVLVRYGGDEFVLVLPETTAVEAAQVASRLVDAIGAEPFPGDPPLSVSISLGLATYPDDAADRHALIELADRRNYLAKRRGRGRAVGDDLQAGGRRRSDRLLERDAAFAAARDFLVRLDARGRGALRVAGERGAGHSRFLAEVGKLAGMRGFVVLHMGDDAVDGGADPAERVLVIADTDADLAEISRRVRRLAGPGGAGVVGLVQAVHDPVGPVPSLPLLDTVVLGPLSDSALHVWLRTTLHGEPTRELVQWLARRSSGFIARAERGLTQLADGGHLEQGGNGDWGVSGEALVRADNARRRLPAAVSSLVGRARDIARVADLLADRRLITLTGAGGIGKTRLSLAVAGAVADEFADGAVFLPLAEATTAEVVVSTAAAALEVPEGTDEPLADTVIRALSGLELLLVLDNFEHVLSAGPFVAALLAAAPGVRVLATSRQRLRLTGEQVYPVPPLPVPELDRLPTLPEETDAALAASPALALFVSRATEAVYGLTFTPDDLRAAAEVCCRLDGLPLAIELTAANCDVLSPTQILAQLNERSELPAIGPQDLPARQRTLRATIDWSFALLDAGDQELLTRLAVFAGGCSADAVAAVCPPPGKTVDTLPSRLAGLVDRNLLGARHTADGIRYTMLETIRAYAGERLAATATDEGPAQRHAAYFASFAERADHGLAGPDGATWYARVSREYLNLRAAYTWAMSERDTLTAARIVLGANRYWQKGWHIREGREWHRQVLAVDPLLPDRVRGWVMESAAFLAIKQDDQETALSLGEKSLRLGRDLGDLDLVAKALNIVGLVARQSGDMDRARACFGECVEIQEARGRRDSILAAASGNLSMIALFEGDLHTARELLLRDVELVRVLGNLRSLLLTLAGLGDVCVDLGDAATARPLLTEAVEIGRRIGDIGGEAYAVHILGRLTRLEGDPVEAYRLYTNAIRQHHGFGDRFAVLYTLSSLIDLLSTAEPALAARMLGAVEVIRDQESTPMTRRQLAVRDKMLLRIRAVLTDTELADAVEAGRAMDLDGVVAIALEVDPTVLAQPSHTRTD